MVFERFHFFHWFTNLVSSGRVLGVILDGFGCPECSLCGFGGSWKQVRILMYFGISPGRPQAEGTLDWKVKGPSWGPRGQTKSKIPVSFGLVFQTVSSRLQAYKQLPGRFNDTRLQLSRLQLKIFLNSQDCNGPPQPDGPWQAGAGGFIYIYIHVYI